MPHVFISYVREDQNVVDGLAAVLARHGIDVWLDRRKIKPGMRWQLAIRRGIEEGAYFIACFSKAYASRSSTFMNEELVLAIEQLRRRPMDSTWFIPVVLKDGTIPDILIGAGGSLRDIHWVDLSEDWDKGVDLILEVIGVTSPELMALIQRVNRYIDDLTSKVITERRRACDGLAEIARDAKTAVPALVKALNDDLFVREAAIRALGAIGPSAKTAVPALIDGMTYAGGRDNLFRATTIALGQIGPDAKEAVPQIIEAMKNGWVDGAAAAIALGGIGPDAKEAIPHLIEMLAEDDRRTRSMIGPEVASALGQIGMEAQAVVPALINALENNTFHVTHENAAESLVRFGPKARPAVPALINALKHEYLTVREAAIRALGAIGPDAKAAVPSLTDALCEDHPNMGAAIRRSAASALGQIGREARDAIPALVKARSDDDERVRQSAESALRSIAASENSD